MNAFIYGLSVSGMPHIVPLPTWPTDPNQLALARCGRLTLNETPKPSPDELCGNCHRLQQTDHKQSTRDALQRAQHLQPVLDQITDEINHRRARLHQDLDQPPGQGLTPAHRSEQSAVITGLLIALAITLDSPGNEQTAKAYTQQRSARWSPTQPT
ncbi:hypothetical protein OG453_06965 [Streptomyces sp. NBC_01381]|uniref:hypothetical protein n=1 Tax=Streptomyces sp. NBC_01381 TaxID=2903845 RepID=UPI00225A9068|nr:hypothetical protein [Streptomyces sp. NBC_01381]MCX4666408.1 hypothetical protein [Streptomyces sp. NBC_01381]